jgi:hypothetical protein
MRTGRIILTEQDGAEILAGKGELPWTDAKALAEKIIANPPKGAVAMTLQASDAAAKTYKLASKPAAQPTKASK